MPDSGCVVGWYPDESAKGANTLKPLVCKHLIASLAEIIAKTALGYPLDENEHEIVETLSENYLTDMHAKIRAETDRREGRTVLRVVNNGNA